MTVCIRCGRSLASPKSIERNIGPICAKKAEWALEHYSNRSNVDNFSMTEKFALMTSLIELVSKLLEVWFGCVCSRQIRWLDW